MKVYYIVKHIYQRTEDNEPMYWYDACNTWTSVGYATNFSTIQEAVDSVPIGDAFTVIECYYK